MPAHADLNDREPLFGFPAAGNKYSRFHFKDIFADAEPVNEELFCSVPGEGTGESYIYLNGSTNTLIGVASTTYIFLQRPAALVCSVSATMSGPGVSESGGDQNCNAFVQLTSTNHQPSSTYCITASHGFPNGSCSSGACVITPGPRVTSLTYELIHTDDLPIDENPNAGGGLRIFPDKKLPNEMLDRRRIRVKAQYSQATAGIRIYFRNFDVDDPSADTAPIDSNDSPTVKSGNDNNGNVDGTAATKAGVLHVPASGQPNPYSCQAFSNANASGVSCETDANGVAIVEYSVGTGFGDETHPRK
ncbi:hypothetical protein [Leptolyngbya sp. 7M]|uniref:hypothetical protein n=1 Tax=Leptolyngbya sp. 7M TaxID=2812896 RepID=UPI001B8D97B4|nr:hypothetical protein [Leptolyngbya sp. 7M]QYO63802.1 hypothetical protein JVX88_28860 [Leptolyngbya sp. 7M]